MNLQIFGAFTWNFEIDQFGKENESINILFFTYRSIKINYIVHINVKSNKVMDTFAPSVYANALSEH